MKIEKMVTGLSLVLIGGELLLVLLSWLVTAIAPEAVFRSLLSGEGIRWMVGRFVDTASSPLLVWLVLLSLAWGGVRRSGILSDLRSCLPWPLARVSSTALADKSVSDAEAGKKGLTSDAETETVKKGLTFRQRFGMQLVVGELLVMVVLLVLLAGMPGAVLLGVTGTLFPSSFSSGFVPILALAMALLSASYGLACGRFRNMETVFCAFVFGMRSAAPCFLIYVLATFFYHTLCFVW